MPGFFVRQQDGDNVVGASDGRGALANQRVAAGAHRAGDIAGDNKNFSALRERVCGGVERTAAGGCFGDEDCVGEPAD